jgi:predicted metalloprotease with PDZ domain
MYYKFSVKSPQQQFIQLKATFKATEDVTVLEFPTWRPGRYQIADFAKKVKHFQVFEKDGNRLNFNKISKSTWEVETKGVKDFIVDYHFYANELNAGSTFLDASQLYVNPVNCCLFNPDQIEEEITVELDIPEGWDVANSLETKNNKFTAENYDELVDSPFICSSQLQHASYEVKGTKFNLWFNGIIKPDWDMLISDFVKFTDKQIEKFLEFPTKEYHFFFQILPYKGYHGVEHKNCTVVTLGPSYAVFEELYKELLGVSSHELYHTWNVKSIRPLEMMPYDFTQENFSELGYIAEGITTYMGDLMLYKSGVFNLDQYLNEMNSQLQRHFDNFGRFNYSVAESSWDTWLDGYELGAPGRKVSIYTEGCLIAFIMDVLILKATKNKKGLDDVMRSLYFNFGKRGVGVSESDYKDTIKNVAGDSFDWFFEEYVHGTKAYASLLVDCFETIGLEMNHEPVKDPIAAWLGAKVIQDNKTKVVAVYPGSAYDLAGGMLGDEVLAINGVKVKNDLHRWVNYFLEDVKEFTVERNGEVVTFTLPVTNRPFYQRYWLSTVENADKNQVNAFDGWRNTELGGRGTKELRL